MAPKGTQARAWTKAQADYAPLKSRDIVRLERKNWDERGAEAYFSGVRTSSR